jgi:hypothetical protein
MLRKNRRNTQEERSARLQHASDFSNHSNRVGHVLENLCNQDDIDRRVGQWHVASVADNIHGGRGGNVQYVVIGYATGEKTSVGLSLSAHI